MSKKDDDASSGSADVVDFDALNAALGALPPPTSSTPTVGESQGRPSATYSSARPHTIPPSHAPHDDLNAPAVIVETEDTVQTGPPAQMTMPIGPVPRLSSSPPPPSTPTHSFVPAQLPSSDKVSLTAPMVNRPRRPRAATIVMRVRGPTKSQKLLVFVSMLVIFVGGGIAFLVIYKPPGLNLERLFPSLAPLAPTATGLMTGSSPPSTIALPPSASASGSVRKPKPR